MINVGIRSGIAAPRWLAQWTFVVATLLITCMDAGAQQWDWSRCREEPPADALNPNNRLSGLEIKNAFLGKSVVSVRRSPRVGDTGYIRSSTEYRADGSLRAGVEYSNSESGPWTRATYLPTPDGRVERGNATVGTWRIDGDRYCSESLNTPARCFEVYRTKGAHFSRQVSGPMGCQGRIDLR